MNPKSFQWLRGYHTKGRIASLERTVYHISELEYLTDVERTLLKGMCDSINTILRYYQPSTKLLKQQRGLK